MSPSTTQNAACSLSNRRVPVNVPDHRIRRHERIVALLGLVFRVPLPTKGKGKIGYYPIFWIEVSSETEFKLLKSRCKMLIITLLCKIDCQYIQRLLTFCVVSY